MAKVGAKIGLTLKLSKDANYEFIRPEVSIEDIDTEKPIKLQLDAAVAALKETWDETTEQVSNLVLAQMPNVTKEMEMHVSRKLMAFEKEIENLKTQIAKQIAKK
jgi:hypothetical protein